MSFESEKEVGDTVRVALRIRPLVDAEKARGCEICVENFPEEAQVRVKGLAFTYNHVFSPDASQEEFYDRSVRGLVNKLQKGYNVTILAYGQTGSGKTYSMGTTYSESDRRSGDVGVIPRAVTDIFDSIEENSDKFDYKVKVSFIELYKEQLYDLLSTRPREQNIIDIREENKNIILPGLTEEIVTSVDETLRCLVRASVSRATGATAMNSHSSRSHAIFTICIFKENKENRNNSTTSKFHLVDLAGSERSKKTKATGDRFKEGVEINKGLLALGNVISALGDGSHKGYVGYRDSKLTRLLQDSLGGNSMTLMIACVSPADYNLEETVSTLRYADRARHIRNKPIVNQDPKSAEIIRLNNLVQQLRLQILNDGNGISEDASTIIKQLEEERSKNIILQEKYEDALEKNKKLTNELQNILNQHTNMIERAFLAEASKDKVEQKLAQLTEQCNQTMENFKTMNKNDSSVLETEAYTSMCKIRSQIFDLQTEQQKCGKIILNLTDDRDQSKMENEEVEEKLDIDSPGNMDDLSINEKEQAYALNQVAKNNQLKDLIKSLQEKMNLAEELSANNRNLSTYNEDIKNSENRISELEKEKELLIQQLKSTQQKNKLDPKLIDERKSKIQQLENEITELRKKCQQQANLIKMKEKNDSKITSLQNEIQQMKAAKVRLIRSMRAENERFRVWKLQNEKKIAKLCNQDRKLQSAMVKMENIHSKQQNVLKRRVEEAVAANKRLKEALERQKNTQKRHNTNINGKIEAVQQWLDEELEFKSSLAGAELTLKGLMEDRSILTQELSRLKVENPKDPDILILEEDIQLRNAQISDLQQKILTGNQENKTKNNCDNVQSMAEAKYAIKYLIDITLEAKKEIQTNKLKTDQENNKLEEMKELYKKTCNKYDELEERLNKENAKHKREIAKIDKQHEEKITTLIKQLNNDKTKINDSASRDLLERLEILRDAFERAQNAKNDLEEENSELRQENENLKTAKAKKAPKIKVEKSDQDVYKSYKNWQDSEEDDIENDSFSKDPNWAQTPRFKRYARSKISEESQTAVKRNSEGRTKCSCKTTCTKRCGCRKVDSLCSNECKCNADTCTNRERENESSNSSNDEDTSENINHSTNKTFKIENKTIKHLKLENNENDSSLLNTGKKKRSFFYNDVE